MFFPERITQIAAGDRVLEVGPGSDPHPRSDVLLEKVFDTEDEKAAQRGHTPDLPVGKNVVTYAGGRFPFEDHAFDYVICSHVLEHVEDVPHFISELTRVARRGYLEYPTVYYDYIYNFRVHRNFLHHHGGVLRWMGKADSPLAEFLPVQKFFYESLVAGHDEIIKALKQQFFEGFEWAGSLPVARACDLSEVCLRPEAYAFSDAAARRTAPAAAGIRQRLAAFVRQFT